MQASEIPSRCPICGYYLTTAIQFNDRRCTDPSHWLAAGQVAPTDYLRLAEIFAQEKVELHYPPVSPSPRPS